MREVVEQIESHVKVMDLNNPASPTAPKDTSISKVALGKTAPFFGAASLIPPDVAEGSYS